MALPHVVDDTPKPKRASRPDDAHGTGEAPAREPDSARDPRATRIVAKTIYRELRQSGLGHEQVMAVAGELLGLVTAEVLARRPAR